MGSIESDPQQRRNVTERLEKWYGERRLHVRADLAEWEQDETFVELALSLWPLDMEMARSGRFQASAAQRLRLRWEGYRAITNARDQVLALQTTCTAVLASLNGQTDQETEPAAVTKADRKKLGALKSRVVRAAKYHGIPYDEWVELHGMRDRRLPDGVDPREPTKNPTEPKAKESNEEPTD